jgi:hypothetical protein
MPRFPVLNVNGQPQRAQSVRQSANVIVCPSGVRCTISPTRIYSWASIRNASNFTMLTHHARWYVKFSECISAANDQDAFAAIPNSIGRGDLTQVINDIQRGSNREAPIEPGSATTGVRQNGRCWPQAERWLWSD